jgi:hypothetical protein
MRKPNYNFERAERQRAKQAKKAEKLQRQRDRVTERNADDAVESETAEAGADHDPA